jgi:hypothetical protein
MQRVCRQQQSAHSIPHLQAFTMTSRFLLIGLFGLLGFAIAAPALAQHNHGNAQPAPAAAGHSAYAGQQSRAIKALSDQQVADLRAGKGMSLALPAELNNYPGPSHTLELAVPLGLSHEQKHKTQAMFVQMQAEAKRLGEQVIASELALDRLFKDGKATVEAVQDATANAARSQGELRFAHLRYHLAMREVLTSEQVAKYNALRGYH